MEAIEFVGSNEAFYLACIALFGLLFGSFLNVVIHRVPIMLQRGWGEQCRELLELPEEPAEPLSLIHPGSHCPNCKTPVAPLDNIPVLSFTLLGGKCRHCGEKIPLRYPLVEILTAVVFTLTAWRFGFTLQAAAALVLTGLLLPLIFIDIDEQILPDGITIPGLWLGLMINSMGIFADLHSALIGAVFGYLSLWSVYHVFRFVTGKEGMGYGDFKLLAMLGAWLGWQSLPLIILLSATVGAVIGITLLMISKKTRDTPIPFGPYLCLAGWIALLMGDDILRAYLQFAGLA